MRKENNTNDYNTFECIKGDAARARAASLRTVVRFNPDAVERALNKFVVREGGRI
jgi:hypothetical protein